MNTRSFESRSIYGAIVFTLFVIRAKHRTHYEFDPPKNLLVNHGKRRFETRSRSPINNRPVISELVLIERCLSREEGREDWQATRSPRLIKVIPIIGDGNPPRTLIFMPSLFIYFRFRSILSLFFFVHAFCRGYNNSLRYLDGRRNRICFSQFLFYYTRFSSRFFFLLVSIKLKGLRIYQQQ